MNLTDDLHDLVAHEPPYRLDPEAAIAGGRRRRRTRSTALALATGTTAAGVVAAVLLVQSHAPTTRQTLVGTQPQTADQPAVQGPLQRLVREHADASWAFTVHDEDATSFDADVDDGTGAGRMGLWLSPPPGSIQQHPCTDGEFAEGARCVETQLDTDTRLIVKGPGRSGPVTTLVVVLVHRDGSGVIAESDNATWPWPRNGVVTPAEKVGSTRRPSTGRCRCGPRTAWWSW